MAWWMIHLAIEAYCWPVAGGGRDVVGIAKTGSGKTLAARCGSNDLLFSRCFFSSINGNGYKWIQRCA